MATHRNSCYYLQRGERNLRIELHHKYEAMIARRILIIENDARLRADWLHVLREMGHRVKDCATRDEALRCADLGDFDLILSDLTDENENSPGLQPLSEATRRRLLAARHSANGSAPEVSIIKAFKLDAAYLARPDYNSDELCAIVNHVLAFKREEIDDPLVLPHLHERIDFALPSDVALMHAILDYLLDRVARLGVIQPESSNLFVALDEAFVNAVKHGNKFDPTKLVYVTAEICADEARFTIEDQGAGFNVHDIPNPLDPANLFKTSGRGVLLIHNIMDEVTYNESGNRVTMVKRPEAEKK